MTVFLLTTVPFIVLFIIWFVKNSKAQVGIAQRDQKIIQIQEATSAALAQAQQLSQQQIQEHQQYSEQVRNHYEAEARRMHDEMMVTFQEQHNRIVSLQKFEALVNEEEEAKHALTVALRKAQSLELEAQELIDAAQNQSQQIRAEAQDQVRSIYERAENVQIQANEEYIRRTKEAHQQAEQIAGDAYAAMRDKQQLEKTIKSIENVINGYGDRYIIPAHSLLDDLAEDFSHHEAGQNLAAARKYTRYLIEQGQAGTCDYVEANRRETAIRFVVDAFNGRVDAVLSRVKHDNHGKLEEEIKDAFNLVNHNGKAFKDARVEQAYLDSRVSELHWAATTQELKRQAREEQRQIKEQMREEEKALREFEKAKKEAEKEEKLISEAIAKAQAEAAKANAEDREEFESQMEQLRAQLADAEAKNQRNLSMAQQTRMGHIYVISNEGSFGEGILKIGMTRRLDPMDRVKELGDASVPFGFDVHAMIRSDDAPTLEKDLHHHFHELRINKVNNRKEFFRVPLQTVRETLEARELEVSFTMMAEAREYRETKAIENMSPEERKKYSC